MQPPAGFTQYSRYSCGSLVMRYSGLEVTLAYDSGIACRNDEYNTGLALLTIRDIRLHLLAHDTIAGRDARRIIDAKADILDELHDYPTALVCSRSALDTDILTIPTLLKFPENPEAEVLANPYPLTGFPLDMVLQKHRYSVVHNNAVSDRDMIETLTLQVIFKTNRAYEQAIAIPVEKPKRRNRPISSPTNS